MDTNCAPLVADLFLFCYERDFMKNLSSDNQADVIKAFNLTSRYLDDPPCPKHLTIDILRPLSDDPQFIQFISHYINASKLLFPRSGYNFSIFFNLNSYWLI